MSESFDAIFEQGVLRPLAPTELVEGERVSVSIVRPGKGARDPDAVLAGWRRVFEGLDEADIREIESIALDRSRFMPDRQG